MQVQSVENSYRDCIYVPESKTGWGGGGGKGIEGGGGGKLL